MDKLFIKTYGCQMNVYDSKKIVNLLKPLGYIETDDSSDASLVILNTCHIREKAEHKVFSDLGRVNDKENTIIVVAGCVAQAEGEEILSQAPYVNIVVGPQTYHRLPELISKVKKSKGESRYVDTDFALNFEEDSKFDHIDTSDQSDISAFLTIQEGCDKFCTYCCVPYTRGAEYSRPLNDVMKEARTLVSNGAKEIVFLGQNVNAYHGRSDDGTCGLASLIKEAAKIDGLYRIRYTTSHPNDMEDDLILAHGSEPKLMPFFHLPVQSGSDNILFAMNRKHTAGSYLSIIERVRELRPDIAVSSDFIIGFPGETDEDFEQTIDLINKVKFACAYSFKYSKRHGTPAATMSNQIDEDIQDKRLQKTQAILKEQQLDFNNSLIGKTVPVLFDRLGRHEGQLMGRSPYMQSTYAMAKPSLIGQIANVLIDHATLNSISGKIL